MSRGTQTAPIVEQTPFTPRIVMHFLCRIGRLRQPSAATTGGDARRHLLDFIAAPWPAVAAAVMTEQATPDE
jgi:hypothetical protein